MKTLFKKGIKTKAKNYWAISLLSLISKVIKKSIHDQKQDYLQTNELLYIHQSRLLLYKMAFDVGFYTTL